MKALILGSISSINSLKDKTLKIVVHSQELTPEEGAQLLAMQNEYAKFYISTENITDNVKQLIDSEEFEREDKSPSQRMRNVLYRYWEQDKKGYQDFELYYRYAMNKQIERIKDQLV